MRVYQWKSGSRLEHLDAQAVGQELEAIQARDGGITPSAVVEAARPPESTMHGAFEWDDAKAAEEYRREQARHLLRSIVVVRVEQAEIRPVRAFVVVSRETGDNTKTTQYLDIGTVMQDEELRRQALEAAKRELAAFRRKYEDLQELAEVLQAIDRVLALR